MLQLRLLRQRVRGEEAGEASSVRPYLTAPGGPCPLERPMTAVCRVGVIHTGTGRHTAPWHAGASQQNTAVVTRHPVGPGCAPQLTALRR